jgi:hypothetical protein
MSRRFEFGKLEEWLRARGQKPGEQLRLSGSKIAALRRDGLSEVEADRYACRVGAMPFQIWSNWYDLDEVLEFDWELDEAEVGEGGQTILPLVAA